MRVYRGIRYPHTFSKSNEDERCVCNQPREAACHFGRVVSICGSADT